MIYCYFFHFVSPNSCIILLLDYYILLFYRLLFRCKVLRAFVFYLFQVLSTVLVCYVCHVLVCHGHIFNTSFLSKLASYKNSFWNPISYILR